MTTYPMVRVHWHDAFTSGLDWRSLDAHEGTEPADITSVGFWVTDHPLEHHVTIAQSVARDGQLGELLHVPEPMVDEIVALHPDPPLQRTVGLISRLRTLRPRG